MYLIIVGILLYIFLAVCTFAYADVVTDKGFYQWYKSAPVALLQFILWVLWPVVLVFAINFHVRKYMHNDKSR